MPQQTETLTRRQKVEERERSILEAARQTFLDKGYEGARMAEIARMAGIAEGTVYIYYKTKVDLMRAVVGEFWHDVTSSADQAVRHVDTPLDALRALADFHMQLLIERYDMFGLSFALRTILGDPSTTLSEMRAYASVFDRLFQRGQDQGVFRADADARIARDVFYGSLDFSVRSLMLKSERANPAVIDNLVALFRTHYGPAQKAQAEIGTDRDLVSRLERVADRLERAADR